MNPVFYYYPFSCATATHILLEESGLDYHRCLVDLRDGKHRQSEFIKINPKGAVPALQIEDGILSENQAILCYVADQVPHLKLIPPVNTTLRARSHEWMNYCAATLHPYVRMVFRPSAYAGKKPEVQNEIQTHARTALSNCVMWVESKLPIDQWCLGDNFSVCDAYLYIMYLWIRDKRMGEMPDCPKWHTLAMRVHQRAVTQAVLRIELKDRPDYIFPEQFLKPNL